MLVVVCALDHTSLVAGPTVVSVTTGVCVCVVSTPRPQAGVERLWALLARRRLIGRDKLKSFRGHLIIITITRGKGQCGGVGIHCLLI